MSAFFGIDTSVLFFVIGSDLFMETEGLSVCALETFPHPEELKEDYPIEQSWMKKVLKTILGQRK